MQRAQLDGPPRRRSPAMGAAPASCCMMGVVVFRSRDAPAPGRGERAPPPAVECASARAPSLIRWWRERAAGARGGLPSRRRRLWPRAGPERHPWGAPRLRLCFGFRAVRDDPRKGPPAAGCENQSCRCGHWWTCMVLTAGPTCGRWP